MNGMVNSKQSKVKKTLYFPKEFYRGEFRCGFFVPKMLKHAWAEELEILAEVDRICKKYNIAWFADSGTLLGAARHKGFIPWDDDIDIAMMRKDYNHFLDICEKELKESYVLVRPCTIHQFFFRIAENFDYKNSKKDYKEFHDYPYLAGIDVFPLDYIAANEDEARHQIELTARIDDLRHAIRENLNSEEIRELVCQIEKMTKISFDWSEDIEEQAEILHDKVCQLYTEAESEEVTTFPIPHNMPKWRFKKNWYRDTVLLDFEYFKIPCPIDYDKILTACYGNWEKFEIGTATHDFPCYKGQRESIHKDITENILLQLHNKFSFFLKVPKEEIKIKGILKQGINNLTVCLEAGKTIYTLRIQNPLTKNIFKTTEQRMQTLVDYNREGQIYEVLKKTGITDDYLFHSNENGTKISYFLNNAKPLNTKSREEVTEAFEVVSYVHGLEVSGAISFDVWDYIEKYEALWGDSSYFADYKENKAKIRECYQYILTQPGAFGLTHFNLSANNFLVQEQRSGNKDIRIIDWEYAGIQDTHIDIAMFALRSFYSKEELDWLIRLYFGEQCPKNIQLKIYCYMSVLSLLLCNYYEYLDRVGDDMTEERISYYDIALEYYQLFKKIK